MIRAVVVGIKIDVVVPFINMAVFASGIIVVAVMIADVAMPVTSMILWRHKVKMHKAERQRHRVTGGKYISTRRTVDAHSRSTVPTMCRHQRIVVGQFATQCDEHFIIAGYTGLYDAGVTPTITRTRR